MPPMRLQLNQARLPPKEQPKRSPKKKKLRSKRGKERSAARLATPRRQPNWWKKFLQDTCIVPIRITRSSRRTTRTSSNSSGCRDVTSVTVAPAVAASRSEEHTSELQSPVHLV